MAQRKQALGDMPLWPTARRSTTRTPRTSGSVRPGRTPRTRPTRDRLPVGVGTHPHPVTTIGARAPTCRCCSRRWPMPATRWPGSTPASRPRTTRSATGCWRASRSLEAAGFLAHSHVWVHPLDLALRDAGLTAPAALAALGAGSRALPHTLAQPAGRLGWEEPPLETLPAADQGVADALALARLLRRLPGGGPHPFGSAAATAVTLTALGARHLDPGRLAAWWDAHAPASPPRRRFGAKREEGRGPRPPLLAGAVAAQAWMESGIIDQADPGQALLAGFGRLVRQAPVRHVFVPVWSAYPAVGFGDRDALPTLRSDTADRLGGWGGTVTWPIACLHLIAESARRGLQELDRLEAAAEQGRGLLARSDRRSRLPDALDALAARAGADAEGAGGSAQDRAADRDRVAADVADGGGGEGGDRAREFSGVRSVRRRGPGARRHHFHAPRLPQVVAMRQTAHSSSASRTAPSATALPNRRLSRPSPIAISCWACPDG